MRRPYNINTTKLNEFEKDMTVGEGFDSADWEHYIARLSKAWVHRRDYLLLLLLFLLLLLPIVISIIPAHQSDLTNP